MSANVETMAYNNEGVNKKPWHGEGVPVQGLMTADECLVKAGLNWTVDKRPIYRQKVSDAVGATEVGLVYEKIVGKFETVRDTDDAHLGVVGSQYTPLQNREAFAFFDQICGENHAIYETAGSLDGGRKIWLLAKLPGHIRVLGDDITEKYLLLANGHDGYFNLSTLFTPVRVVCQNTLNASFRNATNRINIRHTSGVASNLREAGEVFKKQNIYFDLLQSSMTRLTEIKLDASGYDDYFHEVFNRKQVEVQAQIENAVSLDDENADFAPVSREPKFTALSSLQELAEVGAGTEIPGVRGSAYGAFQAVVEWVDHVQPTRQGTNHMNRVCFGQAAKIKERALKVALEI